MKLTKYSQLKHGLKVRGKIYGVQINDMKISINENSTAYLCQNAIAGMGAWEKLGYRYSFWFADRDSNIEDWDDEVADLETVEGLRAMQVGDIIVGNNGGEAKVLEVLTNVFLRSRLGSFSETNVWYTFEEAEEKGWKLKGQEESEEDVIEMTLEEVAELKGIDVSKLRIKDE